MATFHIGNNICSFSNDYPKYANLRKILASESNYAESCFRKQYEEWETIRKVLENYEQYSYELLLHSFNACKAYVIENGIYDFNEDLLLNSSSLCEIIMPISKVFQSVNSKLESIDQEQANEENRREARKNSRPQIVGGGFGLSSALKGMVIAGAINMTTGMVHSAFNIVGNLFTVISSSNSREALYDNSLSLMLEGIRESIFNLLPLISNIIKVNVDIDQRKEDSILKNIADGSLSNVDLHIPFAQAFQAYPFDEKAYKLYLSFFPKEETQIVEMALFFGIDLNSYIKSICTLNTYVFPNISDANTGKSEYRAIIKLIDNLTSDGFCEFIHKEKSMLRFGDKCLCDFFAKIYSGLEETEHDNDSLKNYHRHMVDYFISLGNKLDKNYTPYIFTIGFDSVFEGLKYHISLFKAFAKLKGLKIYWNNNIPKHLSNKIYKDYQSLHSNLYNNPDIYFVLPNADDYLILSSAGFITKSYLHTSCFETVDWAHDFIGSTLIIDGVKIKLVLEEETEFILKIIKGLKEVIHIPILMQLALNNPDGHASLEMGKKFENGTSGFPVNHELAFKYYRDSALKNNITGAEKTAQYYEKGIGTQKDIRFAKYWYELASSLGSKSSHVYLTNNNDLINIVTKTDYSCIPDAQINNNSLEEKKDNDIKKSFDSVTIGDVFFVFFIICIGIYFLVFMDFTIRDIFLLILNLLPFFN